MGFAVVEALLHQHQDEEHGEDEEDQAAIIGDRLLLAGVRADEQPDDAEQGDHAAPDPLAGTFHVALPARAKTPVRTGLDRKCPAMQQTLASRAHTVDTLTPAIASELVQTMKFSRLLFAGFAIVVVAVAWIWTLGPRMKHQLAQCEVQQTDTDISNCMISRGWTFNRQLFSCDNGSARDIGCYETGLPWP